MENFLPIQSYQQSCINSARVFIPILVKRKQQNSNYSKNKRFNQCTYPLPPPTPVEHGLACLLPRGKESQTERQGQEREGKGHASEAVFFVVGERREALLWARGRRAITRQQRVLMMKGCTHRPSNTCTLSTQVVMKHSVYYELCLHGLKATKTSEIRILIQAFFLRRLRSFPRGGT